MENIVKTNHQIERIKERFDVFKNSDLPFAVRNVIKHNLTLLERVKLDRSKSYGIMLGYFKPNSKSEYYQEKKDGRNYYSIIDDKVITDSTGDEFWIVVRGNNIKTFMLRKSIQTQDLQHNLTKLRVDEVIKNIPDFIKNNLVN